MDRHDRVRLESERNMLLRMLADIPDTDALDKASLEQRLAEVDEELSALSPLPGREPVRTKLTFNGRPVIGTEGILADFGAKAMTAFVDSIAMVAASLAAPLSTTGPIPNRQKNQLMIAGTVRGSFGFELVEVPEQPLELNEESMVGRALTVTQNVLVGSMGDDDEQLADAASEIDQRALDKIRTFVNTLAENGAVCTMQYSDRVVRFANLAQVTRSLERLGHDNLYEAEETIRIRFGGAMPHRKNCEFQIQGCDDWLAARISPSVENADEINENRGAWVNARMLITRVGNGQPRYKLLELPKWQPRLE